MRILWFVLLFSLLPGSLLAQQADVDADNSVETAGTLQKPELEPVQAEMTPAGPEIPAANSIVKAPVNSENTVPRPTAGLGLGKMALSLAIVVAVVLALGWTFKKLTLRMPGSRHIKIISTMPLGPKERLLVIEMQGKQRVLGVTAHSINLLFELENSLPEEKLASDFHTQLQSLLKK